MAGYLIALALCMPLLEKFGLAGAAITLIISNAVTIAAIDYRLRSKYQAPIPLGLWGRTALCCIGIVAVGTLFPFEEWSLTGFAARIGAVFAGLIIGWLVLPQEKKAQLEPILAKIGLKR